MNMMRSGTTSWLTYVPITMYLTLFGAAEVSCVPLRRSSSIYYGEHTLDRFLLSSTEVPLLLALYAIRQTFNHTTFTVQRFLTQLPHEVVLARFYPANSSAD